MIALLLLALASVEGTVLNDLTGEPVRGVSVGLMRARSERGAMTDSAGRFRIEGVEAGDYRVRIRAEGYTYLRGPLAVKVSDGAEVRGLVYRMTPQSVVTGRVVDEFGEPVVNASVQVRRDGMPGGPATASDERGEFRLGGVSAGRYQVWADVIEWRNVLFPMEGGGATAYVAALSDEFEVAAGTMIAPVELRLRREPVYSVRGRASTGYTVAARSLDGANYVPGTVAGDGSFELRGLTPGTWQVIANARGRGVPPMLAVVEVGRADVEGVVLEAPPAVTITGQAELDGDAKADWQQVHLMLRPAQRDAFGMWGATVQATAEGAFKMPASGTGDYSLVVMGRPVEGSYLTSVRVGGDEALGREMGLASWGAAPLRLRFKMGAAKIEGRVENRPGVVVGAWHEETGELEVASADGEGAFRMANLRPGAWLLTMMESTRTMQRPANLERIAVRVKLEEGATQRVVLK